MSFDRLQQGAWRSLCTRCALIFLALAAVGCQYNPSVWSANARLSACDGEAATIGIGYSDGTWIPASPPAGETYNGTPGRDVVIIASGPVTFNGLGGDDLICVIKNLPSIPNGTGPIVINTGPGKDTVLTEPDMEVAMEVDGGDGRDHIEGGQGDDTLVGGAEDDVLVGRRGDDTCIQDLASDPSTMCDRSNVIVIMLDDLDETTMDYWDAMPQTLALIADQGITFDEAYAPSPVCEPARAAMLTGNYPHNTGVLDGTPPDGAWPAFVASGAESDTVATRLQAAGYRTGMLGKYMNFYNSPAVIPPGWDDWFGFLGGYAFYNGYNYSVSDNGTVRNFGATTFDYQTDVLAVEAVEFIAQSEAVDDDPFFLFLTPTAPHAPLPPAMRHIPNIYDAAALPTTPSFDEADVTDKSTWLKDGRPPMTTVEIDAERDDFRLRMGTLLSVDDLVVEIVNELIAQDELDETVIIFTSDNGYNLGAHRMRLKQLPYDESARIPMVMAGVDVPVGTTVSDLVTHLDVAATVLDIAGLDPTDVDGMSMVPLIDGTASSWRTDFLMEFTATYFPYTVNFDTLLDIQNNIANSLDMWAPTYKAVRSDQWLYIEWYSGASHEYELYDVVADPFQLENLLFTQPGVHTATAAALQVRLTALASCSGATCRI